MKFVIASDCHGYMKHLETALARNPDADALLFLGDGLDAVEQCKLSNAFPHIAFYTVRGNCDSGSSPYGEDREEELLLTFCQKRILMTHGHAYGVKGGVGGLVAAAKRQSADVVLFGHTHTPYVEYVTAYEKPFYLFNPGSVGAGWGTGGSFGFMEITEGGVLLSHGNAGKEWR